jgi:hypothetical protein
MQVVGEGDLVKFTQFDQLDRLSRFKVLLLFNDLKQALIANKELLVGFYQSLIFKALLDLFEQLYGDFLLLIWFAQVEFRSHIGCLHH